MSDDNDDTKPGTAKVLQMVSKPSGSKPDERKSHAKTLTDATIDPEEIALVKALAEYQFMKYQIFVAAGFEPMAAVQLIKAN